MFIFQPKKSRNGFVVFVFVFILNNCPYIVYAQCWYDVQPLLPPVSSAVDHLRGESTRGFRETDGTDIMICIKVALIWGRRELGLETAALISLPTMLKL